MIRIIFSLILVGFVVSFGATPAQAQCKQQVVYACATDYGKSLYLRDFNTKLKKPKKGATLSGTKWSVVLNKGTRYRFKLCTQSGHKERIVLTLFDAKHPEQTPYVQTKTTSNPKTDNKFDFICTRTGTYYVSIRFKPGVAARKSCAVGILFWISKAQ